MSDRAARHAALAAEIRTLAVERNAVILAHNYQRAEVQDVADFTGDSLGLSREAAATGAQVIVFAGVHFMAETAKILAPDRLVLLPEPRAGCPMADMVTGDDLRAWKAEHPGVPVVTYVNSSAEVKAESDVCVTSANAVAVVRALGSERILFAPDRNLGSWVARSLPEVEVLLWDGWCPTHDEVTVAQVAAAKVAHPAARVMVHPECRPEVVDLADAVLSTSQMLAYAASELRRRVPGRHRGGARPRAREGRARQALLRARAAHALPEHEAHDAREGARRPRVRAVRDRRRRGRRRAGPRRGRAHDRDWLSAVAAELRQPRVGELDRRWLTSFDTAALAQHSFDVLVVGSGIAGLTAALHASRLGRVALVTKGALSDTNTWYAQGGIAGAVGEADSVELHLADTLVVGQGLCDEAVVRAVVAEAPDALAELREIRDAVRSCRGRRGRARARGRAFTAAGAALWRHDGRGRAGSAHRRRSPRAIASRSSSAAFSSTC